MAFITNLFRSIATDVRDANLKPEELREREQAKQLLQVVKLAAIVTTVATAVFLFGFFPNTFTLLLTAAVGFVAREIYYTSQNMLEVLEDAVLEGKVRASDKAAVVQLEKNTFLMGPVARVMLSEHKMRQIRS